MRFETGPISPSAECSADSRSYGMAGCAAGLSGTISSSESPTKRCHRSSVARIVRPMDFTGKPLRGFVYVAPRGVATDDQLLEWIRKGLAITERDIATDA